jgi:hypothetical protein
LATVLGVASSNNSISTAPKGVCIVTSLASTEAEKNGAMARQDTALISLFIGWVDDIDCYSGWVLGLFSGQCKNKGKDSNKLITGPSGNKLIQVVIHGIKCRNCWQE